MAQKGIFWTIREHLYIFYNPIISYQRINIYRIETKDMGKFRWNNGSSGKYNPNKYYSTYCTG